MQKPVPWAGIRCHELPEGADDPSSVLGTVPDCLDGVTGAYRTPKGYCVDDADVGAFDAAFPAKGELKLPRQLLEGIVRVIAPL